MTIEKGSKVLVVDDDPLIRHIVQAILEAEGCNVITADNGAAGLDLLCCQRADPLPKLLVLDVMMPKMNGLELLQELRKNPEFNKLPVLMLTAEDKPEDLARGYGAGATFYMTKPFDRAQLLAGVKAVLSSRAND
jgi:DNA-binding response OmpR family regulator